MPSRTAYSPGTPCWVDLFVPDPEAAERFYGAVLGWTPGGSPGEGYRFMRLGDAVVAGIGQLSDELVAAGAPPAWSMYVRVPEVDAAVAEAVALGATIVTEAFTVEGVGRIGVLSDPDGGVFLLWEPRGFAGAEVVNAPGAWAWNDLQTPDAASAAPFYAALFGWTITPIPGADGAYWTIAHEGRSIGGVMPAPRPIPQPYWTVYFATDDLDATLGRVADAGGRTVMEPMAVPAGRFAVVLDDQGVAVCLIDGQLDD